MTRIETDEERQELVHILHRLSEMRNPRDYISMFKVAAEEIERLAAKNKHLDTEMAKMIENVINPIQPR